MKTSKQLSFCVISNSLESQNINFTSEYFGAINCGVCEVLRPKIEQEICQNFSKIKQIYVNSALNLDISSYFNIFSNPTILVFFENKEFNRYGRNISLNIFNQEIKRLYEMVF